MRGYTYHRLLNTDYEDQPVHWFLFCTEALNAKARVREVALYVVDNVCQDLHTHNYLYHAYKRFALFEPHEEQAHMELSLADPG